jgi:hypothetical protein
MEADGRGSKRPADQPRRVRRRRRDRLSADARYVIGLCDQVVGEKGWREHRFRWLGMEVAGKHALLAVDAYYPARGLVVLYRERRRRGDGIRERLVEGHGLALVTITPSLLGGNRRPRRPERDLGTISELLESVSAPRTVGRARRARDAGRASRSWQLQIACLALVLVAVGAALASGALADRQFWLNVGGALLAFGLAFDLYARVLGVLAARAGGKELWAWACALGGSPIVAAHAALRRSGPTRPELAALLGILVLTVVVAMLLASFAGIGGRG